MKKQLFEDLLLANNNLSALLADALNIAEMQEQFHGGEPLTLALTLGKSTINSSILSANGRCLFADDLFKTLLNEQKAKIAMCVCDMQTFLEASEGVE